MTKPTAFEEADNRFRRIRMSLIGSGDLTRMGSKGVREWFFYEGYAAGRQAERDVPPEDTKREQEDQ